MRWKYMKVHKDHTVLPWNYVPNGNCLNPILKYFNLFYLNDTTMKFQMYLQTTLHSRVSTADVSRMVIADHFMTSTRENFFSSNQKTGYKNREEYMNIRDLLLSINLISDSYKFENKMDAYGCLKLCICSVFMLESWNDKRCALFITMNINL